MPSTNPSRAVIPVHNTLGPHGQNTASECLICLDTMSATAETATHNACGHSFHRTCYAAYRQALSNNKFQSINCPMCRRTVESTPWYLKYTAISSDLLDFLEAMLVVTAILIVSLGIFFVGISLFAAYGPFPPRKSAALVFGFGINMWLVSGVKMEGGFHDNFEACVLFLGGLALSGLLSMIGLGVYSLLGYEVFEIYCAALFIGWNADLVRGLYGRRAAGVWATVAAGLMWARWAFPVVLHFARLWGLPLLERVLEFLSY